MNKKRIISGLFLLLVITNNFVNALALDTNLSVTATVPAQDSDFQTSISSVSTESVPYPQDTEVTYTITYGSTLNQMTSYTLEAEWFTGSIAGGGTVDIVDYVIGSATSGFGGATPVIDTINKTISWDIVDAPANTTNHTVSFTLRSNSDYTGNSVVTFTTASRIVGAGVTTNDEVVETTYKYVVIITPSPTPTLSPTSRPQNTATLGPNPTSVTSLSTPTPTLTQDIPLPQRPVFTLVDITRLTSTMAEVSYSTNVSSFSEFLFSQDKNNLTSYQKGSNASFSKKIVLDGLTPETKYYFKIIATDRYGKKVTSDMFTFETAKHGQELLVNEETSFVTWNQILIATFSSPIIHTSNQKPITVNIPIENPKNVRRLSIKFENKNVLGIEDSKPLAPAHQTSLVQTIPGIFSGEIRSPMIHGDYNMILDIEEASGAFYSRTLPYSVIVGPPIKIVNKNTDQPIENATVSIEKKQNNTNANIKLDKSFSMTQNTDALGELDIVLSSGTYIAEINAPGFAPETYSFTLSQAKRTYPAFYMTPSSFFSSRFSYFTSSIADTLTFIGASSIDLVTSPRGQEISFLFMFLSTAAYSIVVIKNHVSKSSNKKHRYMEWLLDSIKSTMGHVLVITTLILTLTTLYTSGIQNAFPFVITLLLSVVACGLNSKDVFEKYR